ncbi:hypothetical protein GQ42DRAFT_176034 [Ramicandelaber brevisporus]|nr:hypothetical protein GQ42DRAFT_176034 [Ramicandelaber brevisporus]
MNLLNLPRDILLYLTDFFDFYEALPSLFVSSQFHDLFSRAVWRVFGAKVFELNLVTRSAAFARYGHLARLVTLPVHSSSPLLYPPNWHLKLPNVVAFCFGIGIKHSTESKSRIFVGIRSLVNLRRLTAYFGVKEAPYTADGLASIIVARHRDTTKRKLSDVALFVTDDYGSSPWDACLRFCKKLHPLNIPRLRVDGFPTLETSPPPVRQCHALAPHLLTLAPYNGAGVSSCVSQVNGQYFNDKSVVFPIVETLVLILCCHRAEEFDPNCITPERFISVNKLYIFEADTCVRSVDYFVNACLAICTRRWLNLRQMMLQGMIDQACLERIFRANPQLTQITLVHEYDGMRIRRGVSVSPAVLVWLLSLPKLREVSIKNAVLIDPKSALKLIKRIHKKPIQMRSRLSVHLAFPDVILSEECSKCCELRPNAT